MGQVTKAILTVSADVGFAVHVMFLMHAQRSHVDKALSTFVACNSRTCSPCGVLVKEAWVLLPCQCPAFASRALSAWFFMCLFTWLSEMNPSPHRAQWKGLCPVWIFLFKARLDKFEKYFPQSVHAQGLSSVCCFLWVYRELLFVTSFSHFQNWYGMSPVTW